MDDRDVRNAALALYGMIVRPGATIRRISDDPGRYLVPSVAVFATAIALSVLSPLSYVGSQVIGPGGSPLSGPIVSSVLSRLLLIAGIFWIGRRWGGNRSFLRAFPVLAYCLVPSMLGVPALTIAMNLYFLTVLGVVLSDGPGLARADLGFVMIQIAGGIFFIGWILLLHIKAIRILNGFRYARSAAILALAVLIVYAESMARGLITVAPPGF